MKTSNPFKLPLSFGAALAAALILLPTGLQAVSEKFTSNGTFTPPPGVTSVTVEVWGGGGAGGSAKMSTTVVSSAGGGGGGAYSKKLNVPVTPGVDYAITIPAAAVAPLAADPFASGDRVNGENIVFTGDAGVTVTAAGGQGGASAVDVNGVGRHGTGGAADGSLDAAFSGGSGPTNFGNGGGGGSAASDLGNGNNGSANNAGATKPGSDADHNGGAGGAGITGNNNGFAAASPGGGGGGARRSAAGGGFRGGAGGRGQIILSFSGGISTKDNNALDLSNPTSWVGGNAPDSVGAAKWDSTVTSANTTILGTNLQWGSIQIANPVGLVTINPGDPASTLTLAGGIDMSAASSDLTLNSDLTLAGPTTLNIANSRTLTLGGIVSGSFNFTQQGAGTVILSRANTYSGATTINGGTLKLGASDVIPNGPAAGNVTLAAGTTLDLNSFSETINGLSSTGTVDNTTASTTATLTVGGNNVSSNFGGIMQNSGSGSTLNLIKIGSGQFTLGGVNTLSGAVTVNGGNLTLANSNPLENINGLTIGGAELGLSANAVIAAPITVSGDLTVVAQAAGMVLTSLNGPIGGTGNLFFTTIAPTLGGADSKVLIGAAGGFVGNVRITTARDVNNMTVRLGTANALPTTAVVTLDGLVGTGTTWSDLDLFGNDQTLAGLVNVPRTGRLQRVYNSSETAATLTINNTSDFSFSGTFGKIGGNDISLIKSGAGTFTLSGANTYTGTTSVTEGALVLSGTAIPNSNSLSITGTGTVSVAGAGTETVGSLTIGITTYNSGAYTSANTGGVITSGTIQVGVAAGYSAWQTANGTTQTIDMDHDSDGVSNGVEFFLLGPIDTTGFTALPGVVNTGGTLSITFTKAAGYGGVYGTDFFVETSSTLATGSWTNQTLGDTVTINVNDVKYTFPVGTINFARLKVTGP